MRAEAVNESAHGEGEGRARGGCFVHAEAVDESAHGESGGRARGGRSVRAELF